MPSAPQRPSDPRLSPGRGTSTRPTHAPTDFLGQLSPGERNALMQLARTRRLARGAFVFRVGDAKRGVHLLLEGRLKFFRMTPEGQEVILWFCFPGELFGVSEVPAAKGRRINVVASEDCSVATVSDAAFNRFLDAHPRAGRLCRRTMAARLGMLANMLVAQVADDAFARVAKLVFHLGANHGELRDGRIRLPIRLTHQDLASMAGVNRQTVTRILGELRRQGVLALARGGIAILDNDRLRRAVQGE
jgi:CRP/FNR family transcriptional regulator